MLSIALRLSSIALSTSFDPDWVTLVSIEISFSTSLVSSGANFPELVSVVPELVIFTPELLSCGVGVTSVGGWLFWRHPVRKKLLITRIERVVRIVDFLEMYREIVSEMWIFQNSFAFFLELHRIFLLKQTSCFCTCYIEIISLVSDFSKFSLTIPVCIGLFLRFGK